MEFVPLLLILLTFFLLFRISSRARKQQRDMLDLQGRLSVGDQVVTTSGLHAVVAELHEATVVLESAPGQRSTWARQAVGEVLTPAEAPVEPRAETPATPDNGEELSQEG